jgi:hypothetical protein
MALSELPLVVRWFGSERGNRRRSQTPAWGFARCFDTDCGESTWFGVGRGLLNVVFLRNTPLCKIITTMDYSYINSNIEARFNSGVTNNTVNTPPLAVAGVRGSRG